MIQYVDWLPDELQMTLDPDDIVDFLNSFPPRVLHPLQKKYVLMKWSQFRNVPIAMEHLEKIGVDRGFG